ncbi:MAG TPA: 50S ribosomal protein L6 [bacterium]|nr:50S ribosomal protein L6 [bacterium]
MSKIGKRPIQIKEGVTVLQENGVLKVAKNGTELTLVIPHEITVEIKENEIIVGRINESKIARSKHGLTNRLIDNMVNGVSDGFTKELTFTGTGYRAAVNGSNVTLSMGYSHDIILPIPAGLDVKIVKNSILIHGIDKEIIGQFAANVREVRPPEVYKGKGIKYKDELIRRKAGKTAASK